MVEVLSHPSQPLGHLVRHQVRGDFQSLPVQVRSCEKIRKSLK
jgi:hypothetical protein